MEDRESTSERVVAARARGRFARVSSAIAGIRAHAAHSQILLRDASRRPFRATCYGAEAAYIPRTQIRVPRYELGRASGITACTPAPDNRRDTFLAHLFGIAAGHESSNGSPL
ncbi:hypothetical protein B0H17DRAFT_1219916 [Mycena rosella]|uniref:Uncharacterized protein n=1 Tax=Mycena rosella TaxID=1033263 RepID=A0AAD7BDP4_MYCRO|nr:hypothetical protein B0H17DRAFT_1219916 [Mycena rosella]